MRVNQYTMANFEGFCPQELFILWVTLRLTNIAIEKVTISRCFSYMGIFQPAMFVDPGVYINRFQSSNLLGQMVRWVNIVG